MTYAGFRSYVTDVLARLVKVCSQHQMTGARALGVMRWAMTQAPMIWDSFEANKGIDDVANALFRESSECL